MDKSIEDKLFFLNDSRLYNLLNYNIVIDYGCADGNLLRELQKINPQLTLIGFDIDKEMVKLAKEKSNDIEYFDNFNSLSQYVSDIKTSNSSIAVVFSSIMHELFHYHSKITYYYFKQLASYIQSKYIIIRDMINPEYTDKLKYDQTDTDKLKEAVVNVKTEDDNIKRALMELMGVYGDNVEDDEAIAMMLLKYRYFTYGNWERERVEDYFSYRGHNSVEELLHALECDLFISSYNRIYLETKRLDFIKTQTKLDFGYEYPWDTHWYGVYELNY